MPRMEMGGPRCTWQRITKRDGSIAWIGARIPHHREQAHRSDARRQGGTWPRSPASYTITAAIASGATTMRDHPHPSPHGRHSGLCIVFTVTKAPYKTGNIDTFLVTRTLFGQCS